VIDDISPLRQLTDAVLSADAFLFKPADAINVIQGGDNGTPLPKDEPQSVNPPAGAVIDYYLKSGSSAPVTIEIIDAAGTTVHGFSTADAPAPAAGLRAGRGGIPNISILWRQTAEPMSAGPGIHRVVWNTAGGGGRGGGGGGGGGGRGAAPSAVIGTFKAKLTVNGRSYSQTFTVKQDPRLR
jgi:hypothetical protein